MTLRRGLTLVLLVAICSLVATKIATGSPDNQTPDLSSLSDSDLKAVIVRFERTQCYGSCPAYTVTIHGDGRVEYTGKEYVKEKGSKEGKIEMGAVKTLMAEFEKAKFLSLPEDYSEAKCTCRRCTDMATAITELSVRGVTHRVNNYHGCGCAPKALFELESAIDKASGSEQWTGDVSQQGPFGTTCTG